MIQKILAIGIVSCIGLISVAWSTGGEREPEGQVIVVKMVDVSLTEYRFEPADVVVKAGDTVRFEQTSTTPHNVEFREVPTGSDLGAGAMGPYLTKPGETYDVVIDSRFAAGVHNIVCTPHATMGMTGTITVEGK